MLFLSLVLFSVRIFCADPFFTDIDKGSKVENVHRKLQRPSPEFKTVEEEVLFHKTMSSLIQVRRTKIQNLSQKIARLDRAVTLPQNLKTEYRKKQADLDQMRHHLASQHVELMVGSSHLEMDEQDDLSSTHFFEREALEVLQILPPEQQQSFIDGWKVSMVDGGARQTFVTYVAFVKLYGVNHPLTRSKDDFLASYRENFKDKLKGDRFSPKEEGVDFIYDILKDHSGFLSAPIRDKLKSIKILEQNLNNSVGTNRETNLLQRRIDFEKEILLEFLRTEGLELKAEDATNPNFEQQLFEWLREKKIGSTKLGWPLGERGKILYPFNHQGDYSVGLKAQTTESLLASCDGQVSLGEGNNLGLVCAQGKAFEIFLSGFFLPIVKDGQKVKLGDPLATLSEDKSFSLILKDPDAGKTPVDFLLFF